MFKLIFSLLFFVTNVLSANNIIVRSEERKEQIINFIKAFPFNEYTVTQTDQPGSFYLDFIKDEIKDVLRRPQLDQRVWEMHVRNEILRYAKPGTTAVDVGAHIGTFTLNMVQAVGSSGKVIAIEPQPKIFRELVMNMALNQVSNAVFYWGAIGDRMGEIELSPLASGNEGGTGIWGGTGQYVELFTLDSLNLENVSLIKIDVEGMDDQVLDGAKETIMRNRPVILMEIMGGNCYDTASPEMRKKIDGTIDRLQKLGYSVRNLWCHDYLALPR